ncbi:PRC-barrel domain-containing protein [Actinoplanes solisilvae]|uniref:PRC-barrel domain-containing protein n=1 Tax=Actinoplanes solisilvae TaxID=2486853 RepID=UPI000FD829DA|nr:PRC-barrel domain-containing protein [Actinoplanes solisilvae]
MSALMQATALVGRPVVTLAGDEIGQVKDVVYTVADGRVTGFTLAGRGLLAGPLRRALPWAGVHAVGPDAVMIRDEDVFTDRDELAERTELRDHNLIGGTVLTEGGTALGTVDDVVLDIGASADVVGYRLVTSEAIPPAGRSVLLPLPGKVAASGEALVVPESVAGLVVDDLAEFTAAVRSVRSVPEGERSCA